MADEKKKAMYRRWRIDPQDDTPWSSEQGKPEAVPSLSEPSVVTIYDANGKPMIIRRKIGFVSDG